MFNFTKNHNDTNNGDYLSTSLNFAKIMFPLVGFGIGMLLTKFYHQYHQKNNTHQPLSNDEEMHSIVTKPNDEENTLTEVLGNNAENTEINEG